MATITQPVVAPNPIATNMLSGLGGKRIAIYTDDPGEGGVAIYVHSLLCAMAREGLDVTCIQTQMDGPLQEIQRGLGVKHHWLAFHTRKDFARSQNNPEDAKQAFAAVRPDVVLFANCSPFSHVAAKSVALKQSIPYIVVEGYVITMDTIAPETALRLRLAGEGYRGAKAVIAVCQDNLDLLHREFAVPAGKGEIIHYGRPQEFFRPVDGAVRQKLREELGVKPQDVLCLTVARLEPVKGYDCLLHALEQLKKTPAWETLHFVWIGGGKLEKAILEALARIGAADRVHVLGHRWDMVGWYDAGDLFILPSRAEGMPLSIMEAMGKGMPVMASAVSGIPEQLGSTGRLLTSPRVDLNVAAAEIADTVRAWAGDADLRRAVGKAGKDRAELLFREENMTQQTRSVIERVLMPTGDYVSPGLAAIRPDKCFPNMVVGNPKGYPWPYLRWEVPHNWYHDRRAPGTGFANRDEAHILYNTARRFRGQRGLEVGCWLGWSACHLALGGVTLDVIDPALGKADFRQAVAESLKTAGVLDKINLVAGASPAAVEQLAHAQNTRWPLIFIDGDHEGLAPVCDAAVCAEFAQPDALILFHDLASPDVANGLEYLRRRGWNTMVYSTMQIMGVAWRGNVQPIAHIPDPAVAWSIPHHLRGYKVSGR